MKPEEMKIRLVGSKENCERILSLLKEEAKVFGGRRIFKARKFERNPEQNKYSHIFGSSEMAIYVKMSVAIATEEA